MQNPKHETNSNDQNSESETVYREGSNVLNI